ncbi:glycosyltransferase family A protein [Salicola sp. Rm-C-2C1-2]|uniref:glycosyltransferase family 2 protein n=1 Tax=Salicola sp. Rm-C-2C1-2 TaxID=3141321 RepID=UPI0032E46AD3
MPHWVSSNIPAAPAISLLLVTANRSVWLDALIRCIGAQTLTDWEVVAVDCASTDGTLERLEDWARDENRVRVLSAEETDRAIGRRLALQKARGANVAWLDPHTLWPIDFLEGMLQSLERSPKGTGAVYGLSQVLDAEGNVVKTLPQSQKYSTMVRELFVAPQIPLTAILVRRRLVRGLEKTGMRLVLGNDHALLLWLAHQLSFESAGCVSELAQIRPIEGILPPGIDPVSEARSEAMTYALEHFQRAVPARFARHCLAALYCRRAQALALNGNAGESVTSALQALMYRPFWPRAWRQLLSIAMKG